MTTALCLHCGETKFGALCPCGSCGEGATGNMNLDILFSDHRMPVETLEEFGSVIKQLSSQCDEPEVRFWAFIAYLSSHPSDLLKAEPPTEIAGHVRRLLAEADLPVVQATLLPEREDAGSRVSLIDVPKRLLRAYAKTTQFLMMQDVQVRCSDGKVHDGTLVEVDGAAQLMLPEKTPVTTKDIVAIRTAPSGLLRRLFPPQWVEG